MSRALKRSLGPAGLYLASARRVLRARGLHGLGERLGGSEERLVFVIGCPRSGTTFLAGAIGGLPGFVDLTEVNPYKAAIPALAGLPEAVAARRIRKTLDRVRTLALVGGWRPVEQTPETVFVLEAALAAYPEARAVHMVRDGRDVACSLLERGWLNASRSGADDAQLAYGAGARLWVESERASEFEAASDAARAGWAWRAYVTAGRSVDDQRVLEVSYEAIAADPIGEAARVASHLDADQDALAARLCAFHDASIGRFRRDLDSAQLADVEAEAGSVLRELGYL
jgi:Sulfotransferase family